MAHVRLRQALWTVYEALQVQASALTLLSTARCDVAACSFKMRVLFDAARCGRIKVLQALRFAKCDLSSRANNGDTPMVLAVRESQSAAARWLLQACTHSCVDLHRALCVSKLHEWDDQQLSQELADVLLAEQHRQPRLHLHKLQCLWPHEIPLDAKPEDFWLTVGAQEACQKSGHSYYELQLLSSFEGIFVGWATTSFTGSETSRVGCVPESWGWMCREGVVEKGVGGKLTQARARPQPTASLLAKFIGCRRAADPESWLRATRN